MKTLKSLIIVVFTMLFISGIVSLAWAADVKPVFVVKFKCPSGWQRVGNEFKCKPNKPTPIVCPKGYKYYESLDCKSYLGTQCLGCEVGCGKIQEPPK